MEYKKLKSNHEIIFEGPLLLLPKKYSDSRGFFMESWNSETFNKIIKKPINFVQDNHSKSKKYVIRGLHYQLPPKDQGKIIRCISGEIYDVLVDLRKGSKTFLSWAGILLDDKQHKQLWIPPGFAHGFLALSENTEIIYKTTALWSKEYERSISWDDPKLEINWPLNNHEPLISFKDLNSPKIENISKNDFFS